MSKNCMSYKDFVIRFEHRNPDDGSYQILVETHNRKKTTAIFIPPDELIQLIQQDGTNRGERRPSSKAGDAQPEAGKELYGRLFRNQVEGFLYEGLALAKNEGLGLRVKLCVDLSVTGMAQVVNLPWELLNQYGEELCLSVCTPVVRYLDTTNALPPPLFDGQLRILIAMANPDVPGLSSLNLETEYLRIADRFENNPRVEIEKMAPVNSDMLLDRLSDADRPVHVLHFMGHGLFRNGEGQLVFERDNGDPEFIDGRTLVRFILQDADAMQLVFLNACDTAVHADAESDPFAGVASSIIKTGMPAVVAMQKPINDNAAISFADTFYTRLAEGQPVERAMTEGRKKIGILARDGADWAIPVLFMHAPDGVLFPSLEQDQPQANPPAASPGASGPAQDQPSNPEPDLMRKLVYLICDRKDIKAIRPLYKYLSNHQVDIEIPAFDGSSAREIAEANKKLLEACDLIIHYYGSGDAAWKKSIASELRTIPGLEGRTKPLPKIYTFVAAPETDDKDLLLMKDDTYLIDATHIEPLEILRAKIDQLKEVYDDVLIDFMQDVTA